MFRLLNLFFLLQKFLKGILYVSGNYKSRGKQIAVVTVRLTRGQPSPSRVMKNPKPLSYGCPRHISIYRHTHTCTHLYTFFLNNIVWKSFWSIQYLNVQFSHKVTLAVLLQAWLKAFYLLFIFPTTLGFFRLFPLT